MKNSDAREFIEALKEIDASHGNIEKMVELFAHDCEVSNVAIKPLHGKEGARRFWRDYASTFKEVETRFTRVFETENKGYLEWTSKAVLHSGRPVTYEGLTLLEWRDGKIARFKAYHDSAVFLKHGGKHAEAG